MHLPKVTVLTVGTFDLFHYGHVNFLRQAKEHGDFLIVGVNPDGFIKRFKGQPPVMSYLERMGVLVGCAYVDSLIGNYGEETLRPLIEDLQPDKLVVGSDWEDKDYWSQTDLTPEFLAQYGCELVYVPYTETISSTAIKERLREN